MPFKCTCASLVTKFLNIVSKFEISRSNLYVVRNLEPILAGCKSLKLKRSYSLGIFLTNLYSQREFISYKNNKRDLAILLQQLAQYLARAAFKTTVAAKLVDLENLENLGHSPNERSSSSSRSTVIHNGLANGDSAGRSNSSTEHGPVNLPQQNVTQPVVEATTVQPMSNFILSKKFNFKC